MNSLALTQLRKNWRRIFVTALAFVAAYYVLLLVTLVIRFGDWPNYITLHDWPGNVARIVRSTPAVGDMVPIILDEWLLELGHMNHDYGLGVAEWSLTVLPGKLALVLLAGLLLGANLVLLRAVSGRSRVTGGLACGAGMACAGLASASMTWVVCCATPTWAVTLAMLGAGVSTALWLEPLGPWLQATGYLLLLAAPAVLACRPSRPSPPAPPANTLAFVLAPID